MQMHAAAAADQTHIQHTTGQHKHARATTQGKKETHEYKSACREKRHVICAGVCTRSWPQLRVAASYLLSLSLGAERRRGN